MIETLEPRAARRLLRHEIWRRGYLYLLPAALLTILGVVLIARGLPYLSTTHYNGLRPLDGTLRSILLFVAFAIAIAIVRVAPGLGPLLRRLPVDPVALLQARLQLATALGALVFVCFLLTEYLAAPTMMHPSFAGRLNPAETETLARLPGVPLLRFTVDGEVTMGLASEVSMAGILPNRSDETMLWNYGTASPRSRFRYDPPEPGDVLATLKREDWPRLDDFTRSQLPRLGVPAGATAEIALERYVSQTEYLSQPWRRDGLLRARRWHAFDRAIGFLGLLVFLVCGLGSRQTSLMLALAGPITIMVAHWPDSGRWLLRSRLLFSDLGQGGPRIPSYGMQQTGVENLLWPMVVIAACAAAYAISARQMRSEPVAHAREGEGSVDFLKRNWRSGLPRRMELIALVFFVGLWVGEIVFGLEILLNTRVLPEMAWIFAALAVIVAVVWMTWRWAGRDALLSRLPTPPARVAWRRLAAAAVTVVGIALVPLMIEYTTPLVDFGDGWTKSLLITASGSLVMIFSLLGSSSLRSKLGGLLCVSAGLMAMPMLTMGEMPWLTALSLAVATLGLPVIHRLMRRRVELGRAPEISELFG